MKRSFYLLVVIVFVTALSILITRHNSASHHSQPPSTPGSATELLASDLMTLTPQTLKRSLPFTGTLRAIDQATIRAKIAGDIHAVLVKEGMQVKRNQTLAYMDTLETQAHLDQHIANLEIAQREHNNNQRLLKQGFISATAFESSVSKLKAAQAAVTVAKKSLHDTSIRSPINGQVAERAVQAGEKISVDQKLFTIIDPKRLEIEAHIPNEHIHEIKVGQDVLLKIEAFPTPIAGKVARINPATHSDSHAVSVYIEINHPSFARAGMFAEGEIILEQRQHILAIPASALLPNVTPPTVMVIDKQQYLSPRTIALGMRNHPGRDAQIEVLDGLTLGDKILRANMSGLNKPTAIKIVDMPFTSQ